MQRHEMENKLEAIIKEARDSGVDLDDVISTLEGMKDRYEEEQAAEDA